MVELDFPLMPYDITRPLQEGRVPLEGLTLRPRRGSSMVTGPNTPLREGDFGLADLNLGFFLPAVEAGWQLIGLPVFSKRKPVHGYLFCRRDAGIVAPRDLEGKRVGSRQYRTAITVWTRGLLRHRHGVDLSALQWVVQVDEHFPVHDPDLRVRRAPDDGRSMVDLLFDGEVDAILTDISDVRAFRRLETSPDVQRLFPDYEAEDERLWRGAGLFPPVHLIVMSRTLDREHPELARRLFDAFEASKRMAVDDNLSDRGGLALAYLREALRDQLVRMGDLWPHGLAANRAAMETFVRYNAEQGLIRAEPRLDDLFAAGTLDT
jgi:4,5-dihydroxyphthalate decarboxylase